MPYTNFETNYDFLKCIPAIYHLLIVDTYFVHLHHVFCQLHRVWTVFWYYVNFSCDHKGISFKISKTYKSINAAYRNIIEELRRAISFKL